MIFKSAESLLRGRVVFTGFHGDKMWDKYTADLGPEMVRGDTSGADLTEYRLSIGFINCPMPFWGVRQIEDVNAISNSTEMAPWDITGRYSRPICRRIVEEAGVPREMFGIRKNAACADVLNASDFLNADARADYFRWLRSQWKANRSRPGPPLPLPGPFEYRSARGRAMNAVHVKLLLSRFGPRVTQMLCLTQKGREKNLDQRRRLRNYTFHWAMDRAKEPYPTQLRRGHPVDGS